ncbi:Co2+/Mg2+ efflux protein ApaG [Extensimonas perlucida]|uniref:Co2+/Mg2+ efflux protein ApaG n=1 Tax=Extensimonas perlucida TaxID=2590786 RepID=UPI00119F01BF|nr:Co2+/Mg2+ efflux protein ApaG [Extensimonas perlucida]
MSKPEPQHLHSAYRFAVVAEPEYLPEESSPGAGLYRFAYTITITNTGTAPAQLIARRWVICDAHGHTEEVKGLGVVGHQPLLQPGESFQYTSGCSLRTASGTMHGHYFCVGEDGTPFDCEIPLFVLEASDPDAPGTGAKGRVLH